MRAELWGASEGTSPEAHQMLEKGAARGNLRCRADWIAGIFQNALTIVDKLGRWASPSQLITLLGVEPRVYWKDIRLSSPEKSAGCLHQELEMDKPAPGWTAFPARGSKARDPIRARQSTSITTARLRKTL